MIQNQYKHTYLSSTTAAVIEAVGNTTIHTIVCPKALTGTLTVKDKDGTSYFVLPIGSIGSFLLDTSCPNGLTTVLSAVETAIVTTQTP